MVLRKRKESDSEFEGSDHEHAHKKKRTTKPTTKKAPSKIEPKDDMVSATPHSKSLHRIDSANDICDALLKWYSDVHLTRGMPWRKQYNSNLSKAERAQRAYEVWVSEVMLQQTQVSTVIPYYNSWMTKFPTLRDLADAPIDDVNAVWKGLGYYSRASRLLAGAQKVVAEYDGMLPDNAHDMEKNIPGVGRYTAGAICSIAYGERVPVLDGNVHRLLSRVLALHSSPKAKITLDLLWAAADSIVKTQPNTDDVNEILSLVKKRNAGDINQALIELGSTVCKVGAPDCGSCPLSFKCAAYLALTLTDEHESTMQDMEDLCTICEPLVESGVCAYPMKVERKKSREETDLVSVVEWASAKRPEERLFLLVRRPDEGLLAGLYEFPSDAHILGALDARRCKDMIHQRLSKIFEDSLLACGTEDQDTARYKIAYIKPAGDVLHIFSHIRKTYRVQWVRVTGGDLPPRLAKQQPVINGDKPLAMWRQFSEVDSANIATGVAKVWKLVQKLWK